MDVVGRALRRLEPQQRPQLAAQAARLVDMAVRSTPDEFQRALAIEVRSIQRGDEMARLERQRRATRLRSWIDGEGMWCLSARFDPETGVALHGRLEATVANLFAESVPEFCPADPIERHAFLRAQALAALTAGQSGSWGRPEVVVVVDTTTPDHTGAPTIDWGLPVELPCDVLCRLFAVADARAVIVHRGVVLHAPGQLDLGRSTRLANRAQRRALRALYVSCAVPGCQVRFERCELHHVRWWEHGGSTDLHNLLPLCVQHHHAVHDRHWRLTLTADRQLTIILPDGTIRRSRPSRLDPHSPIPSGGGRNAHTDQPVAPLRT